MSDKKNDSSKESNFRWAVGIIVTLMLGSAAAIAKWKEVIDWCCPPPPPREVIVPEQDFDIEMKSGPGDAKDNRFAISWAHLTGKARVEINDGKVQLVMEGSVAEADPNGAHADLGLDRWDSGSLRFELKHTPEGKFTIPDNAAVQITPPNDETDAVLFPTGLTDKPDGTKGKPFHTTIIEGSKVDNPKTTASANGLVQRWEYKLTDGETVQLLKIHTKSFHVKW